MRYLFSFICLLLLSTYSFGQPPAANSTPANDVQSDPKKQKEWNKKKDKMVKQEKKGIEKAKKDLMRAQSPAVRKRMKKNLRQANKFNGQKRVGESPYN